MCSTAPERFFSRCRLFGCGVVQVAAAGRAENELSEVEELDEEEGPNNIARQIAQMTQRFGNAEKDPGRPRLPFHKAHSADLVENARAPLPLDSVRKKHASHGVEARLF